MNNFATPVVTVLMGIIGVAILAVLVSRKANTTEVIKSASTGFSDALSTAISPITGDYRTRKGAF